MTETNDSDFKLKELTHIYIIESPSKEDIVGGINEGRELSDKLNKLNITHEYHLVENILTFKQAIEKIIVSLKPKTQQLACVHLHFSMHGNQNGVGLTSGDLITWQGFADQLYRIAKAVGVLRVFDNTYFPIALSFSTCYGIQGSSINEFVREDQSLYMYVIGPNAPVSWSQSLTAFVTYYENNLHHNVSGQKAVEMMNASAKLKDVFEIRLGNNMKWQ